MKQIVFTALIVWTVLLTGYAYAEIAEPCDMCTDQTIWLIIINDPRYQGGVPLSPSGAHNWSCCPDWLDSNQLKIFPDTLPLPRTIDSLEALLPEGPDSMIAAAWMHQASIPGTGIQIPPMYSPCCCTTGIYWKARMFDASTSTWSNWTDISVENHSNTIFGTTLLALVNTGAFKKPDWSDNMSFDCNVDTILFFAWDCENEPGMEGTRGEFGMSYRTWPDPSVMGGILMDTVFLYRYQGEVGIDDNKPNLPTEFFISQNTPNPFNATTAIQYGLPVDAEVRIEVTNLLGNRVATLVDDWQSAGFKRIVWDGRDNTGKELPSGVYFYQIKANDFLDKKRAILMK